MKIISSFLGTPGSLKDPAVQQQFKDQLQLPHSEPLRRYVDRLKAQWSTSQAEPVRIPYFDPFDGGIHARCLFLLESPGPQARGTGFISRNNPDPPATNWLNFTQEAEIDRNLTAVWNVVPWYVGTEVKLHPIRASDLDHARPLLPGLLSQFPALELVVLVGANAKHFAADISRINQTLQVLCCPHPSARGVARNTAKSEIRKTLSEVATRLSMPARQSTCLRYIVRSSAFRKPKGLRLEMGDAVTEGGKGRLYPYLPEQQARELQTDLSPAPLDAETILRIRGLLNGLCLPAIPEAVNGLDGATYRLELSAGMHHSAYEWWESLPPSWQPLAALSEELDSLFNRLDRNDPQSR